MYFQYLQLELCLNWIVPFVTDMHVTSEQVSKRQSLCKSHVADMDPPLGSEFPTA